MLSLTYTALFSFLLEYVPCTFDEFAIIGFASLMIGSVGVGLFIPSSRTYNNYQINTCRIVDVDDDVCEDSCYYIQWAVKYYIFSQYVFSTIQQTFDTYDEVREKIEIYKDLSNHTCYYDRTLSVRAQWNPPTSPRPYLIMMIVGFSLAGTYLILMGFFYSHRSHQCFDDHW